MAHRKKRISNPPSRPAASRKHMMVVFGAAFLMYANTLFHEYTMDDAIVIYDNMFTTQGFNGIPGLVGKDTFFGFFKEEGKSRLVSGGRYRPLTPILFAIEWGIFGENPFIGHLFNIIYYGIACLLVYLLLFHILSRTAYKKEAPILALGAALIFTAHPVHTEVVANIKGRDEIIALLGAVLAAYLALRAWLSKDKKKNYIGAFIFLLALFAKENAITFLAVIPLLLWFFTKATPVKALAHTVPYLGAAILFLLIRGWVIGWQFGDSPMELMNNPYVKLAGNKYILFDPGEKIATIVFTLGKYIQLLLFPHPLTHDYYPRHIGIMSWADWKVIISLLAYLLLLFWAWKNWMKKNPVGFGIAYFLLTLSIVSNLVFPIGTNMSERFMFMPSLGFSLIASVLLFQLILKVVRTEHVRYYLIMIMVIMGLYSFKTITRNNVWKDNFTLFTTDIKTSSNSAKLLNAVGGELVAQSRKEPDEDKQKAMLEEAIGHLKNGLKIHPNYKNAHLQLGNCYFYLQDFRKAIDFYQASLRIDPDYKDAISNLGKAYRENEDYDQSITFFERLIRSGKKDERVIKDMSLTMEAAGKYHSARGEQDKAINYFERGLDLGIEKAKFCYFIGLSYAQKGLLDKAKELMLKALEYNPNDENRVYIYRSLSEIAKGSGDDNGAAEYLQKSRQYSN